MILLAKVNKKIIITLVILALIGGGAYFLMNKSPQLSTSQTPLATQNQPTTSTNQAVQGTLKSLLSDGKSQKCTYSNNLQSGSVDGTVYIANGKMRGDFSSTSGETKVSGHMIVDGGYSYVWTDLSNQGIKMAIDQEQPSGTPASSQAPDLNQEFTYNCQGWAEDSVMFTPPSAISFSTIALPSVQPSGVAPSGAGINPSACSACDSLPAGEAKATCKAQLGCQ